MPGRAGKALGHGRPAEPPAFAHRPRSKVRRAVTALPPVACSPPGDTGGGRPLARRRVRPSRSAGHRRCRAPRRGSPSLQWLSASLRFGQPVRPREGETSPPARGGDPPRTVGSQQPTPAGTPPELRTDQLTPPGMRRGSLVSEPSGAGIRCEGRTACGRRTGLLTDASQEGNAPCLDENCTARADP